MNKPLKFSEKTFISFKQRMNDIVDIIMSSVELIRENAQIVEIDETIITNQGLILVTTSFDDENETKNDFVWPLGGIERGNNRKSFFSFVENRQSTILKGHIEFNVQK